VCKAIDLGLALETTPEGGFLLIDELENGLHFDIHEEMWRSVLSAAERRHLRIVVTTHSWDLIVPLREAMEEIPDGFYVRELRRGACQVGVQGPRKGFNVDVQVIKLIRTGPAERVQAVHLSRDDLAMATRNHIELR